MLEQKFKEDSEDLYQNAPFGYLTIQKDGLIVNINSTLLNLLSFQKEEILYKKKFYDLLNIGGKIYYETHIMPLLQLQGEISEINIDLKGDFDIKIPVLINAKRIRFEDDNEAYFRFSVLDISQRKQYELELLNAKKEIELANQKLKQSNQDLEDFAYIASHDLKTPLRNIKGILEIIAKKGDFLEAEKKERYFDIVISSATEMNKLIDNLLEFSRSGRLKEELQELNLNNLLESIIQPFEKELTELGAYVKTEIKAKNIYVYPILFKRLFNNLINNSIKYRSQNPLEINITCEENYDNYLFSIKDNGIGIPSEHLNSIFKIFKSLKPDNSNNGIGLSVCKKIVEHHNGKIWVESELGKGSIFYFTIEKFDHKNTIN